MTGKLKTDLRFAAREFYKTWTLLHLYPDTYRKLVKEKPVNEKKIVFLEVRMQELTDSFTSVYQALEKSGEWELCSVFPSEGMTDRRSVRRRSLAAIEDLADAHYIFVNDSSYLLGCLPLRKETRVIQLWHACGAFKMFGYSLAGKKFGSEKRELDRYPMYRNFSYVTVSSPEVVWAYAQAFQLPEKRILPIGIPRTDVFFDPERRKAAKEKLQNCLSAGIGERRIVLYAPTFRGDVAHASSPDALDFAELHSLLGDKYLFLIKHHPFVKRPPKIPEKLSAFAVDVTSQMTIEELLMISDVCISDYSSLIFEYSLYERPMIFFAHDIREYGDWRGFYYPYEEMTPGPVVRTTREAAEELKKLEDGFDSGRVKAFREKFMSSCDGHATERVLRLLR